MVEAVITHNLLHKAKDLQIPYSQAVVGGKTLKFSVPERMARKRVDTLMTKEPTTLTWLNSMTPKDTLLDIGGNVGMYSVWAGAMVGCRVFAFEPESLNYAEFNKNLYLNGLHQRVTCFCAGISDRIELNRLYLSAFRPSYSHHDAGENRWEGPVTQIAESKDRLPQGCFLVTVDHCVEHQWIPMPTHIKIDVDGLEHLVLKGALKTLNDPALQSVLLETDFRLAYGRDTIDTMKAMGWHFSLDQVCVSKQGREHPDTWHDRINRGKGGGNIIYYRDKAKYDKLFAADAARYPQLPR